jgi:hypothetical protein
MYILSAAATVGGQKSRYCPAFKKDTRQGGIIQGQNYMSLKLDMSLKFP